MSSKPSLISLLHRANQLAEERFASASGESEVTVRQLQVLAAIAATPGASQVDLTETTGIDRSTMADLIKRLVRRNLVRRRRSKQDARAYTVSLTELGDSALASGVPVLDSIEQTLLAVLSVRQRAEFQSMLANIVAAGKLRT